MSLKGKRLLKKVVSWAGLFFFAIAAYMIYAQLSRYDLEDIQNALINIPNKNLLMACLASLLGYVALSSYDWLAIKYINKKLAAWKWILTGFVGFSISNNAGHAVLSGGTIRYRMYTRWRFQASEIVRMVTFSGFTYLWACFFLVIIGYLITPDHAFGDGSVSQATTAITALVSAIGLLLYFWATLFYKKPIVIKGIKFDIPSFKMALAQVFIGGADILLASLVLYFSLIPFVEIDFVTFIGVFIIAQVLGVFSQVPGGLGVFEGLFLYILPGDHNFAHIMGALIAYRLIYYLLPLAITGIILFIYEGHLKKLRNQVIAMRKAQKEAREAFSEALEKEHVVKNKAKKAAAKKKNIKPAAKKTTTKKAVNKE